MLPELELRKPVISRSLSSASSTVWSVKERIERCELLDRTWRNYSADARCVDAAIAIGGAELGRLSFRGRKSPILFPDYQTHVLISDRVHTQYVTGANHATGAFSVSLSVQKDIKASRDFYQKLGFQQAFGGDITQNWLIMKNGTTVIGLFQGMFPQNILTFNPGW